MTSKSVIYSDNQLTSWWVINQLITHPLFCGLFDVNEKLLTQHISGPVIKYKSATRIGQGLGLGLRLGQGIELGLGLRLGLGLGLGIRG